MIHHEARNVPTETLNCLKFIARVPRLGEDGDLDNGWPSDGRRAACVHQCTLQCTD